VFDAGHGIVHSLPDSRGPIELLNVRRAWNVSQLASPSPSESYPGLYVQALGCTCCHKVVGWRWTGQGTDLVGLLVDMLDLDA